MACSSCGRARAANSVMNRNSGIGSRKIAAPTTNVVVDSQSITSRAQTPVSSSPNSTANRQKV